MPTKGELIASSMDIEAIRKYLDVDSLGYLSIEGMLSVMPNKPEDFCVACFNGKYPVPSHSELLQKQSFSGIPVSA